MSRSLRTHPYQFHSPAQPDYHHAPRSPSSQAGPSTPPRSTKLSKPFAATSAPSDPTSSSCSFPIPTHLGPELFDAIVQAADPSHPLHAAWLDTYGALLVPSSRASVASSCKRGKLPTSSLLVVPPTSRKSFDHSDLSTLRKNASRKAAKRDPTDHSSCEAVASDADDPLAERLSYLSQRASFDDSARSCRSSSIVTSSRRRRHRRFRQGPKPLVPPIPPPRITSSPGWQSTFGSPSVPELTSSTPRTPRTPCTPGHPPSPFGHSSDEQGRNYQHSRSQGLGASSSTPSSQRMMHPYAFARPFGKEHRSQDLPFLPPFSGDGSVTTFKASAPQSTLSRLPLQNMALTSDLPGPVARTSVDGPVRSAKSSTYAPRQLEAVTAVSSSPCLQNTTMQDSEVPRVLDYTALRRKSTTKIRQLLGSEAPALGEPPLPVLPDKARLLLPPDVELDMLPSPQSPVPAIPPKNAARKGQDARKFVSRVPVPPRQDTIAEAQAALTPQDAKLNVPSNVVPMRRHDRSRHNDSETESSDGLEAEDDLLASQVPAPSYQHTPSTPVNRSERRPGVVRRSLDSIVSPFRAGLQHRASSDLGRMALSAQSSSLTDSRQPSIVEGRRSFSDSRLAQILLPDHRDAISGRQTRPLSKIVDHSDDGTAEVLGPVQASDARGVRPYSTQRSQFTLQDTDVARLSDREAVSSTSQPDASLRSTTSISRSLASIHSPSTSNVHDTSDTSHTSTFLHQGQRGMLGTLLTKVKGSITPKKKLTVPSRGLSHAPSSSMDQSQLGSDSNPFVSASPSLAGTCSPGSWDYKPERASRIRAKSLTALPSPRSKCNSGDIPAVPAIPAAFATTEFGADRPVRETLPQVPTPSSFPTGSSSHPVGKLLWRKKVQQGSSTLADNFATTPSAVSSLSIVQEAIPRSSVSSARGSESLPLSNHRASLAQSRTTIRKTLSPALLSESFEPLTEAGLGADRLRENAPGDEESASSYIAMDDGFESLEEAESDEQHFRSPAGRFTRAQHPVNRLSRVEEQNERLSWIAESSGPSGARASASDPFPVPSCHTARSFSEHRSMRRSVSGNPREQILPSTLQVSVAKEGRPRNVSLDMLRPGKWQEGASPRFAASCTALDLPESPHTPGKTERLVPSRLSMGLGTPRSGRTSFSQDRDRAPVASPISPLLPSGSGFGQAFKRMGRRSKGTKGIGHMQAIQLGLGGGEDDVHEPKAVQARHSAMSADTRASFSGTSRPCLDGHNSSFEVSSPRQVQASALEQSPAAHSFGSNGMGPKLWTKSGKTTSADGDARPSANQVAGMGFNSMAWPEATPSQKNESLDVSGSASEGTVTTHDIPTPETGSLSHSYVSPTPTRADLPGAMTPLAGRGSIDVASQSTAQTTKAAELTALQAMLGRFRQQEKALMQDITARVAQSCGAKGESIES